jgi:hypothetical protein
MANLTPKQEAFCRNVAIRKLSQAKAYKEAYPDSSAEGNALYQKSSALMAKDKIKARVMELRDRQADRMMWNKERATEALLDILQSDRRYDRDAIQAIKELNALWVEKEPEKIEANLIHTVTRRILKDD